MIAMEALLLAAAVTGAGETVLLDFTMEGCGACVQMEPTVRQLKQAGYPVRKINLNHSPMWARHYRVSAAPTFVMLANGREVDRVVGSTSPSRLKRMFETAGYGVGASRAAPARKPIRRQTTVAVSTREASPEQAALNATVRIQVNDALGSSYGTGTIVDVHDDEALVVTCGHLFRDSAGRGQISVDLKADGQSRTVPGTLLSYDADHRDIAVLSVRPGIKVKPVKVAGSGFRARVGAQVFSIGCDRGADPSVRRSRVTAIDKYSGPPNIEVAGQPVDGRSGGGLFTADGKFIGVCNAADPQDDEGLYAALATIHWQLDKINQSQVYQRNENLLVNNSRRNQASAASSNQSPAPDGGLNNREIPKMPNRMPASELGRSLVQVSPRDPQGQSRDDREIIVLIRSRSNPNSTETIVLSNPSPQLLAQLRKQRADLSEAIARTRTESRPQASVAQQQPQRKSGPVVRAQSH